MPPALPDRVSVPSISYKSFRRYCYRSSKIQTKIPSFCRRSFPKITRFLQCSFPTSKLTCGTYRRLEETARGWITFCRRPRSRTQPETTSFLPWTITLAWSFSRILSNRTVCWWHCNRVNRSDDVSNLGFNNWLAENKIVACDCNLGICSAATGVKYEEVKYTIENYKPRKFVGRRQKSTKRKPKNGRLRRLAGA